MTWPLKQEHCDREVTIKRSLGRTPSLNVSFPHHTIQRVRDHRLEEMEPPVPLLSHILPRAAQHRSVPRPPRHTRKANNGSVAEVPSSPSGASRSPRTERPQPKRSRSTRRTDAKAERKAAALPKVTRTPPAPRDRPTRCRVTRCALRGAAGGAEGRKVPRAPLSLHLSRRTEASLKLTEALSRCGERRRCSERGWGARATITSRIAAAPHSFPRVLRARHGTARPPARRRLPPARHRAARSRSPCTSRPPGVQLRAPVSAVPAGSPAAG